MLLLRASSSCLVSTIAVSESVIQPAVLTIKNCLVRKTLTLWTGLYISMNISEPHHNETVVVVKIARLIWGCEDVSLSAVCLCPCTQLCQVD